MSSFPGIEGQILEVTVVGCSKLRDTELFSLQDPYVCVEYANSKFRARTCTDGGRNPIFEKKFQIPLVEGLRELNVTVWNSNTFTADDFFGSGRIQLHKVLSQGYDDNSWPLQAKHSKFAGEVKVIMHFQTTFQSSAATSPSAPPYLPGAPPAAYMSLPMFHMRRELILQSARIPRIHFQLPAICLLHKSMQPPAAQPYYQPVAYPGAYYPPY